MTVRQLPLPVGLRDGNTVDSFLPSVNPEALAAVQRLLGGAERLVYLWGAPDTGRTHLLEAAADAATRAGRRVAYLVPGALPDPSLLDGMGDTLDLVCLDDVDQIAGDRRWEEAIFHLFNALREGGGCLLVAACAPPAGTGIRLPDLVSRLGSGLTVGTRGLDDEARLAVLTHRAARRGLELPPETARYLLARTSRRLADLVALLATLDSAALVHQRRLTVPFVRQVLGGA